jgi:hypothetical protein
MNRKSRLMIAIATAVLAVMGGAAVYGQDKLLAGIGQRNRVL